MTMSKIKFYIVSFLLLWGVIFVVLIQKLFVPVPVESEPVVSEPVEINSPVVSNEIDEGLNWVIDAGFRLENSSNSRIMRYEDGVVHLGHEYRAQELKDEPGRGSYVAISEDGLNFGERTKFQGDDYLGDGILLLDGTYRRYREDMVNGWVVSQSSTDGGVTWADDPGYRYDLNENDAGWMGVRAFWVNDDGGVGFIYNTNQIFGPNGEEIHSVRLAYSEPGDDGMNFELIDDNPIEDYVTSDVLQEMAADPHFVKLEDGRIRLIVMRQDHRRETPPLEANGSIVTYISEDGFDFQYEGEVVSWDDFEEWDVISLNDPKIMELDDGRFRVYVAAWIPDEDIPDDVRDTMVDGRIAGYRWIIVSITTEL